MNGKEPDVRVDREGNIFMFEPLTQAAKDWVAANVQLEGWAWLGNRFAVDQHYAADLAAAMQDAELEVV